MQLLKEDILEFQKTFKDVFGEEISYEQAFDKATRLLNLYRVVYGTPEKI